MRKLTWKKLLIFVVVIISIPYILLYTTMLIFYLFDLTDPLYNPIERNHIKFKDASVDEITDSLERFEYITRNYIFPRYEYNNTEILMSYWRDTFSINSYKFYKPSFDRLRKSIAFENLNDNQIKEFLTLYKFLFNNGITPGSLHFNGYNTYRYKDFRVYAKNHDGGRYEDDLERWIIKREHHYEYEFNNDNFYKIIDSNKKMYLFTYEDARIYGDSVPYTFKKWE